MWVKTSDNQIVELDDKYAEKSYLFSNLLSLPSVPSPPALLIDSKTLSVVYSFMIRDSHILKRDYNPLEIHFSSETLSYFEDASTEEIINICNAASYLEYPYLLEVCCKILAMRLGHSSMKTKKEILGEKQINEEEMELMLQDFDWANENL